MSLINQVLQDLEKRHASESELNTLPPHVRAVQGQRRSSKRMAGVIGLIVAALALAAIAAYVYKNRNAPADAPEVVSVPAGSHVPEPLPVPTPTQRVASSDVAEAQPYTYNAASRLSNELSLATPSAKRERPATVERSTAPGVVSPPPRVIPAPLPAQPAQAPAAAETPPRSEVVARPAAPAAERLAPVPPPEPIAAADSSPTTIDKQMREVVPAERAEILFRKGVKQIQEGRANAAAGVAWPVTGQRSQQRSRTDLAQNPRAQSETAASCNGAGTARSRTR